MRWSPAPNFVASSAGARPTYDVDPAAVYLDRIDRRRQFGLYVQDQMRLSERLLLTFGLRADRADDFDAELSPRLSLVYRQSPEESLKLMFGSAYRSPNLYERFYADNDASQRANPALQPERVSTVELAWQRALGADARVAASAYAYRLRDLIDFVALDDQLSQYQNVSGARTAGVDLDVEQRGASGWQWRASLSLARARERDGSLLTNSPRWLTKGHLLGPLGGGFSAGVEAQAIGRRESLRGPVPSQATVNGVLRYTAGKRGSLALKVLNVADRATSDPASTENELRQRAARAAQRVARLADGALMKCNPAALLRASLWRSAGCCLALLLASLPAATQALPERELKAQIVLRSLLFVQWPAAVLAESQPLALCIAEPGGLADALEALAGQSVNGHRLEVRRVAADRLQDCHVAYVGQVALDTMRATPRGLLLVGDAHALTERGVMLNLLLDQRRVVFDIDLLAARRAGIELSTQLLRLARFVRQG